MEPKISYGMFSIIYCAKIWDNKMKVPQIIKYCFGAV